MIYGKCVIFQPENIRLECSSCAGITFPTMKYSLISDAMDLTR